MSLPNYLAKIKSAGIYRFVWDKSQAPIQAAETLRLVVGYSEKGPFNTPVYIDNTLDFKTIFGGISKKLEKRGIFFHRMALQALEVGPILALNLKPFNSEEVTFNAFDAADKGITSDTASVLSVFDTNRFWTLEPDLLPTQLNGADQKYIIVTAVDSKETSCTYFIRKYIPTGYDVTVKTWYSSRNEEIPTYLESCQDMLLEDTFAEVYVFRGKFTPEIAKSVELSRYFDVDGTNVSLKTYIKDSFGDQIDTLEALASDENSNFIQMYRGTLIPYFKDNTDRYISLDLQFNLDNNTHKMLMKLNADKLDSSTDVRKELCLGESWVAVSLPVEEGTETASTEEGTETTTTTTTKTAALIPNYLEGYTYSTITNEKGVDLQKKILEVLSSYKGIINALTNNVDVEYHYIVDTFQSYPQKDLKGTLALLAKKKDNCLLISNFPFMQDLVRDSQFITNNTLDVNKIKQYIALPTANDGASWSAYYTAITLSDGTVKTYCPSAAVVSNLFMEKYNTRQPYSIVAGPNYGVVNTSGMIGPDYNFSRAELDFMETFGVNCLVYVPRRGTQINSNQTAKQSPVSALSKVHVRELVIYLQDEIATMLQNYQWEFNTQTLRDTVKAKADKLLENVQQNGGVYAFKNVCDETNNTDDVINNEMLVLSTHIEPGMGAGKMVEELTIYRKGGMTSSAI